MSNSLEILVVDDSQTTRAMINRILHMTDLPIGKVHEASDGTGALRHLETSSINLVSADLNMPGMDGNELIERMRQQDRWKSIPVLVISAQPDPEQIERLKAHGVAGYLAKPFTPEGVRDLIMPCLAPVEPAEVLETPAEPESFNLALAEALAGALETMAFISPELMMDTNLARLATDSRLVRIDFKGADTKGSLALAASPLLGSAIAANLNLEAADASDDALKELANVTCGLLLRMRPGGGVGFALTPPSIAVLPAVDWFKGSNPVTLQAEGHLISAQVVTDAAFYGN